MIVIPPSSIHLKYFTGLAEDVWKNSLIEKGNVCYELTSEDKTLVVNCNIENGDSSILAVKLHFRYFKSELYCFIEESEE